MIYIKAKINSRSICICLVEELLISLHDILHDNNYVINKSSHNEWFYNLRMGNSYEVNNREEFKQFISNNEKAKEIQKLSKRRY